MIHEETAALFALAAASDAPKVGSMSTAEAREMVRLTILAMDGPAGEVAAIRDFKIVPDAEYPVIRLFTPLTQRFDAVLVYYHGGGWVVGDIDSYSGLCVTIANTLGLRVASVDYRMAPEYPFPIPYEDCLAAAAWVATTSELGNVPGIILAGDSAGGNLAAAVSAHWQQDKPLLAQFLLYPVTDISKRSGSYTAFAKGFLLESEDMDFYIDAYAPDAATRHDPRLSPRYAPVAGLPPTFIATASLDVLRDEAREYAAHLIASGIETHYFEAQGYPHGWATTRAAIPSANAIVQQVLETFSARLALK